MSTTEILTAALEKLETFVYVPPPEIIWPGIQKSPPETGIWLQVRFAPNEPYDYNWGEGCVDTRGHIRILVYFRPDQGQLDPSELADALIAFYPKGFELGPVRVRKRPWQSPMVTQDASKLYIPVTIPYMGLT